MIRFTSLLIFLFTILLHVPGYTQGKSVEKLFHSLHLVQGQDSANAHKIFDWITKNVKYDIRAADAQDETGNPSTIQTPEKVVKNRRGICEGYSNLFLELCEGAAIECQKVVGYVTDNNRKFYQRANLESHAWNALKIGDHWSIVDCTWGSGGVDEDKRFRFEQDLSYFMASSVEMADSHYPMDPIWQLRNDPISLDDFKSADTGPALSSMHYSELLEDQLAMRGTDSLMFLNERILNFDPSNTMALSEITMSYLNRAQQITVTQHDRLVRAQKKHLTLDNEQIYFTELEEIRRFTEHGSEYLERIIARGDAAIADYKREARISIQELQSYLKDQGKWLRKYFKDPRPL